MTGVPERLRPLLAPDSPLQDLARRFSAAGHSLYLVGGSVRDALLGATKPAPDYDLTTEARPDAVLEIVRVGTSGHDGRPIEVTEYVVASDRVETVHVLHRDESAQNPWPDDAEGADDRTAAGEP